MTLRKNPISMLGQESRRVLSGERIAPPHPTDAINDSAEKFHRHVRTRKHEGPEWQAYCPAPPHGRDQSRRYTRAMNCHKKLIYQVIHLKKCIAFLYGGQLTTTQKKDGP